ncbi:MAG: oxidoreductase [Anaerolineaceae bacterium]|nr:oxidoreductase [Anaerolineaceae bacterium]
MLALPLAITWFFALFLVRLDGRRAWVDGVGIAGLSAALIATLWLATAVWTQGPVEMITGGWPAEIGIRLRADALGVTFALLANGLLLLALVYESFGEVQERTFPAVMLFLATGLNGLFLTGDAFNFYVFFEVSMTASFVLTSYGHGKREIRDALLFTVVNLLGSVLFLGAVVGLYRLTGTLDMRGIAIWADAAEPTSVILIATLIFVAFGVKLGLFPFHFWLPAVYQGVQPVIAAVLSGVLANIGSYGLLRFGAGVLTREVRFGATMLLILGVASVVYGALLAISRRTANEVLAYSSISQAGYILVAIAVGGPVGYAAAVLFAVVNALNKTLLFLVTGVRGWLVGAAFVIGAFSVAGVPPAVGFFGKAALFHTGIEAQSSLLVAFIFLGGALAFIYMFQIYQREFWAQPETQEKESPLARRIVVLGLSGFVLLLGLWPEPLLAVSQQAAALLQGGP